MITLKIINYSYLSSESYPSHSHIIASIFCNASSVIKIPIEMQRVCEFEAIENRNQYIIYNYFSPAALAFPPSLPYSINIFFTAPSALSVMQTMIDIGQCELNHKEE